MLNQFESFKLKLLNIGYAKLNSNWNYNNVISPYTRLYMVTKGEAYIYHNNKEYNIKAGNMYLIPSYTYSSYRCNLMFELYHINFFEELGNKLSIYDFINFKYQIKATKLDEKYFERLLYINPNRGLNNDNPEYYDNYPILFEYLKKNETLSASTLIETHGILKILLSKFINNTPKSKKKQNLNSVLNYISENLHDNLTISSLANFCNLSVNHFSRKFLNTYGIRPNKYIQLKRIERAQLLLLTTNNSLKQISEKVGFDNISYFSRTFKKIVEKTPAVFRKENIGI